MRASRSIRRMVLCAGFAVPSAGLLAQARAQASVKAPAASPVQAGTSTRQELVGLVRDSTGKALADVEVEVRGTSTRTLADGFFRLSTPRADTATISLRRLGFAPETAFIAARAGRWDTLLVVLRPVAQLLDPMKIENVPMRLRAFEERRRRGVGVFITRAQILEHDSMMPSDVLRTQRGVRLVRLRQGGFGVRFTMFSSMRPNCVPALWIDGQRARDMELDELTTHDIEGIELYDSFSVTPFEFSRDAELPCGTIVVWTRVPGER